MLINFIFKAERMSNILFPDNIRTEFGLKIKEKIIPYGTKWPKHSPTMNHMAQYKLESPFIKERKLSNGTGKVEYITIHNIERIKTNTNSSMAEHYISSTWPKCNMGWFKVHYYIDEEECWQQLREDEIGYHIEKNEEIGNKTSLSIAIIMDENRTIENKVSEERGALLSAILLHKHDLPIERLVPHQKWNKDRYCPAYILPHWAEFVEKVSKHLYTMTKHI